MCIRDRYEDVSSAEPLPQLEAGDVDNVLGWPADELDAVLKQETAEVGHLVAAAHAVATSAPAARAVTAAAPAAHTVTTSAPAAHTVTTAARMVTTAAPAAHTVTTSATAARMVTTAAPEPEPIAAAIPENRSLSCRRRPVARKDLDRGAAIGMRLGSWPSLPSVATGDLYLTVRALPQATPSEIADGLMERYGLTAGERPELCRRITALRFARAETRQEIRELILLGTLDGEAALASLERIVEWLDTADHPREAFE